MFHNYFSQDLKEGEEVIKVVRKHGASFMWPAFKTFLILIVPFFFISWLFSNLVGLMIFLLWLAVGIVYGLNNWVEWYLDLFILTDKRIIRIEQKGLFRRKVLEYSYNSIENVTYEISGPLAMAFGYGDVKVQSGEHKEEISISKVSNPKNVQEMISTVQAKMTEEKGFSAQELIETIAKDKAKDGEDESDKSQPEKEDEKDNDEELFRIKDL